MNQELEKGVRFMNASVLGVTTVVAAGFALCLWLYQSVVTALVVGICLLALGVGAVVKLADWYDQKRMKHDGTSQT